MTLQRIREELETRIDGAMSIPGEDTALSRCAQEFRIMIHAYHSDGITFLQDGDLPNALASFAYALGWLDAGSCLGLISSDARGLPETRIKTDSEAADNRWNEKTRRYRHLLDTASRDLEPASEDGSCLFETAERILLVARTSLAYGTCHDRSGNVPSALAEYSYGFGWLDAGVRTGLFRILNYRELFTI